MKWFMIMTSIYLTGCLPKEVRDWNLAHPIPCEEIEGSCGKETQTISPPAVHYTHPQIVMQNTVEEELKALRDFIQKSVPGAKIVITSNDSDLSHQGMEQLPFKWREMNVWIKRPPINDKPIKRSA